MKLAHKLMAAPALASVVLIAVLAASIWVIETSREAADEAHAQVFALQSDVARVERHLVDQHVGLYRAMAVIGSMSEEDIQKQRQGLKATGDKALEDVKSVTQALGDSPKASGLGQQLSGVIGRYVKAADNALDLASVDPNTGVAAMQTADSEFVQVKKTLAAMGDHAHQITEQVDADVDESARRMELALGLIGVAAAMTAGIGAWMMQSRVVRAIAQVVEAAREVAQGHFDRRLQRSSDDEIGDLMQALDAMVQQLSQSLFTVRQAAQSIGMASVQIASGNQDLSSRTEQAASSLQQTAASMEQLTGTVRQTADSARSAHGLAESAATSALQGGSVMDQVVANMAEIDAASRKINDIISVIDGIAFQTNILALNAAVEAARAGEQGRGFAVVAGEVRALAQRSAQAAREIKTLIGASSEQVALGTRLVHEAGQGMHDIVQGVQRVSQIIGEITSAAEQETDGIVQVNQAVSHLDQMTQQNAALVEESAAAADHLRQQAQRLTEVVEQFRLSAQADITQP